MKKIALFKAAASEEAENSFENILRKEHFIVYSFKTLEFTFTNLEKLKSCLDEPAKYAGIIFTSPRCVTSVQLALNGESLHEEWKTKQNYGVGPKTAQNAQVTLNLHCLGAEAGNANNLSEIILSARPSTDLPFLYPKGNLAKDTLKQNIKSLYEIIVYETFASPNLEKYLRIATKDFKISFDYVVFFSPSGVNAVSPFFTQVKVKPKVIAIGSTTEACLKEFNIVVDGTPEQPSAESLIALLNTLQ